MRLALRAFVGILLLTGFSRADTESIFVPLNSASTDDVHEVVSPVEGDGDRVRIAYPPPAQSADGVSARVDGNRLVESVHRDSWIAITSGPQADPGQAEGVSWGDYDGDGDLDLYVANDDGANLLLWNDGLGQFTEDTGGDIADAGYGLAISWGDYDNDGNLDLYLARFTEENLLFRNNGSGSFTDVTTPPLGVTARSRSAPWVDYDNDGYLDLYVVNEIGGSNVLLHNEGDGTFVDATSPPLDHSGVGNCVAWGDYDNDGDPDAYLANWGQPNVLFRNDGGGSFVDVTSAPLDDAGKTTSVCWGDYDNDGDLDLYVCNAQSANGLFRNDGGDVFTDVTSGPLGSTDRATGAAWSDFDNDGDLDLYVANFGVTNLLLVNDGGGVFSDGTVFPLDDPGQAAGVTWGDYDGDGDTDLYVGNWGSANLLLENRASLGNHWLHLELEGTMSNRSAIGARARVVTGGVSQIREISGGSGYASQASPAIEFGLGGSTLVDTVQVTWPSGITTVLTDVAVDQVLLIDEGPTVTIYVDGSYPGPGSGTLEDPFPTISEGIAAVPAGGVVSVAPWVYVGPENCNLDFGGKNLSLVSQAGADSTIIKPAPGHELPALTFHSGETRASLVEGFTITEGYVDLYGAAVQCVNGSSPTLRDLVISSCSAQHGGGILCSAGSSPLIEGVWFVDNVARCTGGGIYVGFSNPVIRDCVFTGNEAQTAGWGAGLFCGNSSPTVESCTFVRNIGGSVVGCTYGGTPLLTECIIAENAGDAIFYCEDTSNPTVTHSCIYGNAGGDSLVCGDYYDNIFVDPVFCDPDTNDFTLASNSPCLPENNPWGEQIGALGQGCFAPPDIEVEPLSIAFVLPEGGATCDTLLISNLGGAELNWTLTEACEWLTAAPDAGTVPLGGAQEVLACADASGLVAGNYQCDVTIGSDDPDEPEVLVDVSLEVQVPPDIEIDPPSVAFQIEEGASACDTVAISNVGVMDLTWSLSDTCEWLSVSPEAGVIGAGGTQDVELCADASVLAPGDYGCDIIVWSNDPDEPEVILSVSLTVSVDMHFEVVYQGNPYLAMAIVALTVTLNGADMEAGDEVGVFDGEYCVGAAVLDSPVGPGDALTITAAADDPITPEVDGFTAGNPIHLKVWSADQEREFEADGDFWNSPGVPDDGLFEELGLTYVDIMGHSHFAVVFQGNPYNAMSIFVMTASIDGLDLEPDDEIGVFDGDICVGTGIVLGTINPGNMLLLSASADDPVTPEVDGFTAGNQITLKLWDESGQTEHGTMAAYWSAPGVPAPGVFQELGLIYVDVFTSINQTIPLDAGWNIMSFNIVPPECDLLIGISDVLPCLSRVVAEDGSALFYNEFTEEWVNNIGCMDIRDGYYIRMNCPDDLSLDGGYVQYPISDTLTAGWNIAGFPYYSPIDAMELYADLISDSLLIRAQDEAGLPLFYDPFNQQWVNLIGDMEPGEGYYVSVNEDCDMVFEAPGVAALQPPVVSDLPVYLELSRGHAGGTTRGHFEVVYEGNPYLPMLVNAISVTLDGIDMIEGDEVGLFDGELCVGAAVLSGPVSPGSLLSVPASYDDPNTPESDGLVAGHSILLRVWDAGGATEHQAEGAFWQSPGVPGDSTYVVQGFVYADIAAESGSGVEDGEEDGIPRETRLHPSFPNPFGPSATLAFDLGSPEVVSLAVYSLDGRKVAELLNGPMESGHHAVAWDGRSDQGYELPSGIYFCRLEAGDYSETMRMTLIR